MGKKKIDTNEIKMINKTKKVQLIVDTDRFETEEEKKAEVNRVYDWIRKSMFYQSIEMNKYMSFLYATMTLENSADENKRAFEESLRTLVKDTKGYIEDNEEAFKKLKITEKKIKNYQKEIDTIRKAFLEETKVLDEEAKKVAKKCFGRKKNGAYTLEEAADMPVGMGIVSVRTVEQDFITDLKKGLAKGVISVRNYKSNTAVIVPKAYIVKGLGTSSGIRNTGIEFPDMEYADFYEMIMNDKKPNITYRFVNDIRFKIVFGNPYRSQYLRTIFDRIRTGEYTICGSTMQIDNKNHIILNLSYQMPINTSIKLDEDIVVGVDLGMAIPAVCTLNKNDKICKYVGDSHELERRKKDITEQRRKCQKDSRYNIGGHGRKRKLQKLEKLRNREKNTTRTINQTFARQIVQFALDNKAKYINLENLKGFSNTHKGSLVLRNWCYYQLQQYIECDAKTYGIVVRYVNPAYTSRTCSVCGIVHTDEDVEKGFGRISQDQFICKDPNCESHKKYKRKNKNGKWEEYLNADRNASRNIAMSENFKTSKSRKEKEDEIFEQMTKELAELEEDAA